MSSTGSSAGKPSCRELRSRFADSEAVHFYEAEFVKRLCESSLLMIHGGNSLELETTADVSPLETISEVSIV